jgi:hypothetical protein
VDVDDWDVLSAEMMEALNSVKDLPKDYAPFPAMREALDTASRTASRLQYAIDVILSRG